MTPPPWTQRIATLAGSTHPGPTVVVTLVALALGVAVGLDAGRLTLLTVSVLCGQLSIGLSNDAVDARRDATTGRTDKPLARAGAPVRTAMGVALVTATLAIVLSAACGPGMALAHAAFLACAWGYNLGLKSTVWSAACFLVGFGIFPSLAPLALAEPRVAPAWAWIVGAALGVAVHFSNVLPDLDDDLRTGVRGLPHRFGRRLSAGVAFGAVIVGAVASVWAPALWGDGGRGPTPAAWVAGSAVTLIAVIGLVVSVRGAATRLSFRLVMLAALLLAVQLVISGWAVG